MLIYYYNKSKHFYYNIMNHWSEYWQSTEAINSFEEGNQSQGYSGLTKLFWENSLIKIHQKNYRALDIGTGNGGLAILLLTIAKEKSQEVTFDAIDPAQITPDRIISKSGIPNDIKYKLSFHPQVYAEKTPFNSNSYQLIVSQFGFEYSDTRRSLEEIDRLLTDDGFFVALCHSKKSSITKDSSNGISVYNFLLRESPLISTLELLLDLALKVIPQIGDENWLKHPYFKILISHVEWIFKQVNYHFEGDAFTPWIEDVSKSIYQVIDNLKNKHLNNISSLLRKNLSSLNNHIKRLEEQVHSSLSESDTKEIKELCKLHFSKVNIETIYLEEGVECIAIQCEK